MIEEEIKLVSITSTITGAIIPPDSPPHSIPKEIQSLDITLTGGVQTTETSFTVDATDGTLHSASGSSLGWSSVFQLMNETETDVTDTLKQHGQLAPEALKTMTQHNSSLYSANSKEDITQEIKGSSSFVSASYPSNHERESSFDNHGRTSSFDRSYPPFFTPQHIVPRPRGGDPGKTGSISLTSSPARRGK